MFLPINKLLKPIWLTSMLYDFNSHPFITSTVCVLVTHLLFSRLCCSLSSDFTSVSLRTSGEMVVEDCEGRLGPVCAEYFLSLLLEVSIHSGFGVQSCFVFFPWSHYLHPTVLENKVLGYSVLRADSFQGLSDWLTSLTCFSLCLPLSSFLSGQQPHWVKALVFLLHYWFRSPVIVYSHILWSWGVKTSSEKPAWRVCSPLQLLLKGPFFLTMWKHLEKII